MTRKKFVKTLMASGVRRNSAVRLAQMYNELGISYDDALGIYMRSFRGALESAIDRMMKKLIDGISAVGNVITELKENIMDNTERFVAVTHGMKVRDGLRYCAGVFDGEECCDCPYEGCTTELMLDAAHTIERLLEVIHDLAENSEK